jgi:hypothetical protein
MFKHRCINKFRKEKEGWMLTTSNGTIPIANLTYAEREQGQQQCLKKSERLMKGN